MGRPNRGGSVRSSVSRKLVTTVAILLVASSMSPVSADASSKKVPGKPKIVVVETTQARKNRVNIRVRIELPKAIRRLPVTGSEVKYGSYGCKISRRRTTCVIRNVPQSPMILRIQARSKNKNGFGKYSGSLRVMPQPNRWIRAGYTSKGTKVPAPIMAIGDTRLLANSQNQKWNKLEALQRGGVGSFSAGAAVRSSSAPSAITFRTGDVVGLALADGSISGASGLYAVRSDGSTLDAVVSGSADIQDFYVAPNNRYYVVFKTPVEIAVGQPACILAEVDADSGNPRCVDTRLAGMYSTSFSPYMNYMNTNNPAIQFDGAGNIYFIGYLYTAESCSVGSWCERSWRPTLRKSTGGVVRTVLDEYVENFNFLVESDGSVIVSGQTNVTGATWTRRISSTDVLTPIDARNRAQFLTRFADGNVYFGLQTTTGYGIRRFISSTATLDPKWWIAQQYSYGTGTVEVHHPISSLCSNTLSWQSVCGGGAGIRQAFNINGQTLAVSNVSMNSSHLLRLYPQPELITTSMANITVAAKVGDKIALAGTDAAGVNGLILYDPLTAQETVVIGESNQLEVYSLAYVTSTRKLMFNGLDFATNRYVMGEVTIP